jgi:hypothetical protein
MKRVILVLVLRFPISLAAQEGNPSAVKSQSARSAAAQANLSTAGDQAAPAQTASSNDLASDPGTNAPQQPINVPSQSTPPPAPPVQTKDSPVGYIDNPIAQNQIRIRFDAAFEDQFPDRSEFFYAKCSCYRALQTLLPPAFDPGPRRA